MQVFPQFSNIGRQKTDCASGLEEEQRGSRGGEKSRQNGAVTGLPLVPGTGVGLLPLRSTRPPLLPLSHLAFGRMPAIG